MSSLRRSTSGESERCAIGRSRTGSVRRPITHLSHCLRMDRQIASAPIALAVSSGVQSDAARPEAEPVGLCLALGHVKLKQVWFSLSATVRQRPSTFHLYRSVLPGRSPSLLIYMCMFGQLISFTCPFLSHNATVFLS